MRTSYVLAVCLMTAFLISCKKDEVKPGPETGSLQLNIGLSVTVHDVPRVLKSTAATEDFKVIIYSAGGAVVRSFDNASDVPDTIVLEIGNYYVEAHSENDLPAAFENPYYFGSSRVFTIRSNMQESVLVSCELANTVVSVNYSENTMNSFTDYNLTVASQLDSLVFLRNETRHGYFRTLPLDIIAELTYQLPDGSDTSKVLWGQIQDPLPKRHYEILVDAVIDDGMASFQIMLDSSEVAVEVFDLSDGSGGGPAGSIGYGDLLITEIMYNPSALSDTEGEWFEIYNNSVQDINLEGLILGRDDINRHTITDSIVLSPGEYYVLERTVLATAAANVYVYSSDITLSNTGAVLSIFNEGTETNPGPTIFSVNYGETDFPEGTGASISLNPGLFNTSDAILGTSWCVASSAYSTGDLGTPGSVNVACQ